MRKNIWLNLAGVIALCYGLVLASSYVNELIAGPPVMRHRGLQLPYTFNAVILFSIFAFFFLITNRFRFAVILLITLFSFLTIANAFKLRILLNPLFISDFYFASLKTTLGVMWGLSWALRLTFLAVCLSLSYLGWLMIKTLKKKTITMPIWQRLVVALLALAAPLGYTFGNPRLESRIASLFKLNLVRINTRAFYETEGLAAALVFNVKLATRSIKVRGYSEQKMNDLAKKASTDLAGPSPTKPQDEVNVIVVLVETFWDPLLYKNLQVSPDPIPFFRSMMNPKSNYVFVPAFGGGTATVEFELLTGLSSEFIWGFPYATAVFEKTHTLAQLFRHQAYETLYLHGYKNWFYDRNRVIPLLGFQQFQYEDHILGHFAGQEIEDMRYIEDRFFMSKLIDEIKKANKQNRPYFFFASTYGTHGPFIENENAPYHVNPAFTTTQKERLRANLALLKKADVAMKQLYSFLRTQKKKTLLIAFGDHLPTKQYLKLNKTDFTKNEPDLFRMPYFIWANYPLRKEQRETSINYFYEIITANTALSDGQYSKVLASLKKHLPVFSKHKYSAQKHLGKSVPDSLMPEVERYKLLQYDTLYGKQYLLR